MRKRKFNFGDLLWIFESDKPIFKYLLSAIKEDYFWYSDVETDTLTELVDDVFSNMSSNRDLTLYARAYQSVENV